MYHAILCSGWENPNEVIRIGNVHMVFNERPNSVPKNRLGQVGVGILKLITFGGCGIWWIVDIILVATKYKFKDIEWVE